MMKIQDIKLANTRIKKVYPFPIAMTKYEKTSNSIIEYTLRTNIEIPEPNSLILIGNISPTKMYIIEPQPI